MAKPELPELHNSLIELLLQEEGVDDYLSVLLAWISGDCSTRDKQLGQSEARGYIEKLSNSTHSSFTTAFLGYVRTESERIVAEYEPGIEDREQGGSSLSTNLISSEDTSRAESLTCRSSHSKTLTASTGTLYDSEFPVLGVSNSNISKQLPSKPRRVNPTPMESPIVNSAFVFAKIETIKQSHSSSSRTQSLAPLKVDMDALMRRSERRKLKPKIVEEKVSKQSCEVGIDALSVIPDGAHSKEDIKDAKGWSGFKDGHNVTGDSKTAQRWSAIPNNALSKLKRFAIVHCKLVTERLVPSLIGELHYLFQLISLGQCTMQKSQVHVIRSKLFRSHNDCALYACIAMEHLGRVLDSVGEPLLSAMISHPMIAHHAPALLMQMKQSLAKYQASTLHSVKSYKASNSHTTYPRSAHLGLPVSLPFQAERDSRNHYKSRESQKLYNNRELCRDYFYAIIREAASFQNSFGYTLDDARSKTQESVRNLMNNMMIENYPWFTELFLEHLVQVAVCGETDPVVTGFARQDPTKLQKLHDRLILGSNNKPSRSSLYFMLDNKGNSASDTKGAAAVLKSRSYHGCNLVGMGLVCMFPQALRVYVWIMEAADSYRLGVQMVWILKSKIYELTEIPQHSRDSAEIGSVLTQRVLSLKALASLLGFLCFSPVVGLQNSGYEWESLRTDPPINVVDMLERAMMNETLLLTLPWILDYLQLIKSDQYAVRLPYFQKALQALRKVYDYSILDPKNDSFGAPSMCILSLLDKFFESEDPLALDGDAEKGVVEPGMVLGFDGYKLDAKRCRGIDRLKGVVDASYIQQCCPTLMELRMLLTNSEEHPLNSKSGSKLTSAKVKSLRKITPIHSPKGFQIFDQGSSFGPCEMLDVAGNHMQMKLQQSFFEQHQELQRLVDFVVDTAAVNAAQAASSRSIPPILEEALGSLERTLANRRQASIGNEEESQQEIKLEAEVENIITSCIQKALPLAFDCAKKHSAERSSEALALLANPDERPFVLGIAGKIAADSAALAACKKTLANISCEIRKKITQELESWRRRLQNINSFREERPEQQTPKSGVSNPADSAPEIQGLFLEDKENIVVFRNIAQKDDAYKQGITYEVLNAEVDNAQQICHQDGSFLVNRALRCCAVVADCCEDLVKVDNRRHILRVKLAVVATSLEIMLSSKYGQIPLGGFDSLIYPDWKDGGPLISLESDIGTNASTVQPDEVASDTRFRIERGLAKRCVAFACHLCLQSPCETFGYDSQLLGQCRCFTALDSEHQNISAGMKTACRELMDDETSTDSGQDFGDFKEPCEDSERLAKKTPICTSKDQIGGLMSGLLRMFAALESCGICEVNFFLFEFFSSWRWNEALLSEPWKASGLWFQAVKHGIANILIKVLFNSEISHRNTESFFRCFELFFTAIFEAKPEDSTWLVTSSEGHENLQNIRIVIVFVFLEMFKLDLVQRLELNRCRQGLAACRFHEIAGMLKTGFRSTEVL